MDKLTERPPGKTLFEQLEEKHQQPIAIIKSSSHCASCAKSFTKLRQPAAEFHSTPEGLPQPVLFVSLLCRICAAKYRSGGDRQRKVLAAVEEGLEREVSE